MLILNLLEMSLISLKTDGIGKFYTVSCVNNKIMDTIGNSIPEWNSVPSLLICTSICAKFTLK